MRAGRGEVCGVCINGRGRGLEEKERNRRVGHWLLIAIEMSSRRTSCRGGISQAAIETLPTHTWIKCFAFPSSPAKHASATGPNPVKKGPSPGDFRYDMNYQRAVSACSFIRHLRQKDHHKPHAPQAPATVKVPITTPPKIPSATYPNPLIHPLI